MATEENGRSNKPPLGELVNPDLEVPISKGKHSHERRKSYRFTRSLSGKITTGDKEHPVTCLNIGYGGIHVFSPDDVQLDSGESVEVEVDLGTRTYKDHYSVCSSSHTDSGTDIHLRL